MLFERFSWIRKKNKKMHKQVTPRREQLFGAIPAAQSNFQLEKTLVKCIEFRLCFSIL